MIRKLEWDSQFFSLNIGEWQDGTDDFSATFDVIYVKSTNSVSPEIEGYKKTFGERKVIFVKKLSDRTGTSANVRIANKADDVNTLYELAYESGKYSRFRLDERFSLNNFEKLYRAWIDNSINGSFADEVLVYEEESHIEGLVTFKKNSDNAVIGLIAVSPDRQGKGIGKKLLETVEQRLVQDGIYELRIPTQMENEAACTFYTKLGYTIAETTHIMHYWKT